MSAHFSPRLRDLRDREFPFLEAHWNDPAARLRERAEIEHNHALSMSMMDAALERTGNRWPADWSDADKATASRNASRAFEVQS